jgi:hypothetical protein
MSGRPHSRGFSLLEVIIAAGLFAGSVAVIIALLAVLSRQAAETTESLTARGLPDAVKIELDRLAASGFDLLATRIPVMTAPLPDGLPLVASRDGREAQSLAYLPPATARFSAAEQFYFVECWTFPDEPLRFNSSKASLAIHVRISWPYRLPGLSAPVPLAGRNQLGFAVAINR